MSRYTRYPLDDGWRPPERMMAEAPLLDEFQAFFEGEDLHLRGTVHGSPDHRVPDGSVLTTGVIQVFDESEGYALSYSGCWRLGARKD